MLQSSICVAITLLLLGLTLCGLHHALFRGDNRGQRRLHLIAD